MQISISENLSLAKFIGRKTHKAFEKKKKKNYRKK